ncbi:MAG: hypothetical protein HZB55_07535 [Deltaproteobacteria bacterium]|nr:hypothetical protein [Deltaproteobacteria bacterium]
MAQEPAVTLAALEAAFGDAGEDVRRDLSAVHVAVVRDCHYDLDLTLEVSVFGRGGEAAGPLLQQIVNGPHHAAACDEVERTGHVQAVTLFTLFADDLLRLLGDSGHPIVVNPGWVTEAFLRAGDSDPEMAVEPEEA